MQKMVNEQQDMVREQQETNHLLKQLIEAITGQNQSQPPLEGQTQTPQVITFIKLAL